jgi:hypothetical protein
MLEVQKYLRDGKTLDDLHEELGIKITHHEELPLVILNYDQIESPKTHPIVRECRGLVLHSETFEIVALSFKRFFNWGEVADEMGDFDFSSFHTASKEDGSLVLIYHHDGHWMANTRGSFAQGEINYTDHTWDSLIREALGVEHLDELDDVLQWRHMTYVCELVSPFNKIVRTYRKPQIYLLTAFSKLTLSEMPPVFSDVVARKGHFLRPDFYDFTDMDQIKKFLQTQEETDPTFEGVVICDKDGRRWKIKNPTYLALHKMRGDGDNLFHPKYLLPFILSGEKDELLAYFPEVEGKLEEYDTKVKEAQAVLEQTWQDNWQIEDQKEFALAIVGKTKFTGMLFTLRKKLGAKQTLDDLRAVWRDGADSIMKTLFKK